MAGNRPAIAISTIEAPWAPGGKALFQMMGVFAEFERAMIVERVKAGLARARSEGRRLGRPRTTTPEVEAGVRKARAEDKGIRWIAREFGISHSTVTRIING